VFNPALFAQNFVASVPWTYRVGMARRKHPDGVKNAGLVFL
jgi:hypothetical protein